MNSPRLETTQISIIWEQTGKHNIAIKNKPPHSMVQSEQLARRDSVVVDSTDLSRGCNWGGPGPQGK